MNILFTIQHQLNKLPKAEKKLAEWILQQPEEVIRMSAKTLSQASNTSPATVVRLCYSLGLEGFTDLKLKLSANQPAIKEDLYTDIVPGEGISTIKQKLLLKMTDGLEKNCEKLETEPIERIVRLLETTETMFTYGIGASGIVADDFAQKFLRVGKKVIYSKDYHLLTTAIVTNEIPSWIFLVSNSGEKQEVVNLALLAKEQGIPVVGMTSKAHSSLATIADVLLHTADGGEAPLRSSATNSLLVQLYTVDVLLSAYATKHYDKILRQLEQTKTTVQIIEQND
ncbi:MurR/RpiR family transcriptional regulator [Tetragenococcus koreensis]|uniref:SIS domain-containing protein n=2 Tax=Tetragenococcus TaxID=51668 RepID=A0AB37D3Z6_TETHA|nr:MULTISPECIES: MurR/RpiR family transcriptional regulator [Tetragenococcus]MCF1586031.1 MurR/RpiR family transcriptional regulator [Tetragenococcus koreensis]MCF1615620.1 MurR/RpiR family transcriptional regulator [Tetragenococcus koreensis]MCF1620669.1 MurR/RpiR family transcriptional regulator [Tetragenococcus koreensis]MCF1625418.1 MurR/RpiR family transcriptional regulator [Tetragenococcus koreensis]MCF1630279.1 MurR/RpiR family transcriptional regulator [Tetragenococcus koreensis]